ncbi:MAG TPA: type 1 glutamine amidotransferase-like domain-containing protein [Clostridiaceae bacterium]|jgi:peptidase E|nr:type 1 glutamine amidotransferase-like domain-containing protein [Clostridiaceae bacterium]
MIIYLTSNLFTPDLTALNPENELLDSLRQDTKNEASNYLIIAADPENSEENDQMLELTKKSFLEKDFAINEMVFMDRRNCQDAESLINEADVIILFGGHVPTQNKFFQEINLKDLLANKNKIVMGISAGSMNMAAEVYALPELEGEAVDPDYKRFLSGLGLVEERVIPHSQILKDVKVDGMLMIDEIAKGDSYGNEFYVIPDGTYLYVNQGKKEWRGKVELLADGTFSDFN